MSRLLRCVAHGVMKNAGRFLFSLVPGGEVVYDIAISAYEEYRLEHHSAELRAEVQALAAAPPEQLQGEVQAVVEAVAGTESKEVQQQLADYLSQVPASCRRSLRRPSDPAGLTVPPGLEFKNPEDLLPLLPSRPPRFRRGQRPLPGVAWELVELLGSGGFGEVWLARHATMKSKKPVALKFCLDPAAATALRNEAGVLDQLQQHGHHPGIVPLQEVYLDNHPPCLQYEYVGGGDLAGLLQEWWRTKEFSVEKSNRLFHHLVKAVAFAHGAKPPIVHCDLKPANILVECLDKGHIRLRITDFGIGGLAAQGALERVRGRVASRQELLTDAVRGAFTPLYASPEQKRRRPGEAADPRDDVHALGVIWFQLLSGELTQDTIPPDWRDVLAERGVPMPQMELLARCIASKAEKRWANAVELARQLAELKKKHQPESPTTGTSSPPSSAPQSQPTVPAGLSKEEMELERDWRDRLRMAKETGTTRFFLEGRAPTRLKAWQAAAERGHTEAQVMLADIYIWGKEGTQPMPEAVAWFFKAAEQGDAVAQFSLGWLYDKGKGVPQSDAAAVHWYRQAAEQGNANAQNNLAFMYSNGRGVPESEAEAMTWFRKAEQGGCYL
jgi:serine/threonine protein kinase